MYSFIKRLTRGILFTVVSQSGRGLRRVKSTKKKQKGKAFFIDLLKMGTKQAWKTAVQTEFVIAEKCPIKTHRLRAVRSTDKPLIPSSGPKGVSKKPIHRLINKVKKPQKTLSLDIFE
jgi:hypothetical protein